MVDDVLGALFLNFVHSVHSKFSGSLCLREDDPGFSSDDCFLVSLGTANTTLSLFHFCFWHFVTFSLFNCLFGSVLKVLWRSNRVGEGIRPLL